MRPFDPNRHFYVKYSAIIQSSGMGKSRAVDEMSKFHFVISVNLRELDSTGIPTFSFLLLPFNAECSQLQDILLQTVQHMIISVGVQHK